MNARDIGYALAKQVPDMVHRGFTIETAYGAVDFRPSPMSDRIAEFVRRELEVERLTLELMDAAPKRGS